MGALYFHDSTGEKGNSYLIVDDSILQSKLSNVLCPYTLQGNPSYPTAENNKVHCTFVHNTVNGEIWDRNGNAFEKNFILTEESHGNTISRLNYTETDETDAAGHEIIAEIILQNLKSISCEKDNAGFDDEAQNSELRYGNKFVSAYENDTTRASSVKNVYLEKGQTVIFLQADKYQWALAKTDSEDSVTYHIQDIIPKTRGIT